MHERAPWFRIGHVTNAAGRTGCTVILFDQLVPATVDVRGGAPGTRETSLLESGRLVGRADAILLTGGSAFGLGAAEGVMRYLAERGRGVPTGAIPVPIVPAAVIFDLANEQAVWPGADDGYRAAVNATATETRSGPIGAGTGATVAKLGGGSQPGGVGIGSANAVDVMVTAVVVVNAVGDVVDPSSGRVLAGAVDPEDRGRSGRELVLASAASARAGEHTSIGVVLIDGDADRETLQRCCVSAHDALARCIVPSHTIFDGDMFFAASRGAGQRSPSETLVISVATEIAVERAIVSIFDTADGVQEENERHA